MNNCLGRSPAIRRSMLVATLAFGATSMAPVAVRGQGAVALPAVTVFSPRVANQSPAVAFAMPISALRFEPRVDLQGRNLAEGQADVTIRGGIFENTALQVGAVTLGDPQTGHYLFELPIAPMMLGAPRVQTGVDLALGATNSTVGFLSYAWRPVERLGAATIGWGQNNLRRAEVFQGFTVQVPKAKGRFGVDLALAHSRSDGAVRFGDHDFGRANVRLQHAGKESQTDLFAGYQGKRFGWPNLYTPFGSNESENLQTRLLLLNHRVARSQDDVLEFGVFDRRNKDDYAFNRFAPLGPIHPFQHTTWLRGGSVQARQWWGGFLVELRGELQADRLESSSLIFGRYRSRTLTKAAVMAGKNWSVSDGGEVAIRLGGAHDDTNREAGSFSPALEIARTFASPRVTRAHLGFSRSTQVPTYTALNSSSASGLFRGNPNLGRSASSNLELGVEGNALGWAVESALFFRQDRRLVDWTFRSGVAARTANAVDVEVSGVELGARRSWRLGEVNFGYTALGKSADYRGARVDASFYALNYARHRLTAAFTFRPVHGVEVRIDNAVRMQAENLLRVSGGDDAVHTAIGLSFRPSRMPGLELSLAVDNLWNESFQEVPAVPASPRQISFSAGMVW